MAFYIFHSHRVCLVDLVDLICSLYSWWEGVGSSCCTVCGFHLWFYYHLSCGSSAGVCSRGCPGGLGSAPVKARCGGGAAAWVTGVPAAPGTQGCWLLGQQEIQCSRRVWQPVLAHMLLYSCLENPPTEKPGRHVYWVAKSRTRLKRPCACKRKTYFACGSSTPVRVSVKVAHLLGLRGPWSARCAGTHTASAPGATALSESFSSLL